MENKNDIPTCPICGNTLPPGKVICWCCEHEEKLGLTKKDNHECGKDSCEIDFSEIRMG